MMITNSKVRCTFCGIIIRDSFDQKMVHSYADHRQQPITDLYEPYIERKWKVAPLPPAEGVDVGKKQPTVSRKERVVERVENRMKHFLIGGELDSQTTK